MSVLQATLRGAAQVFFSDRAVVGAVFLAAIAVGSLAHLAGALVGLVVATASGRALGDGHHNARGLHGFNGVLVGVALVAARGLTPGVLASTAVVAALSPHAFDALFRLLHPRGLAPLTAPFVVLTWLALVAMRALDVGAATPPPSSGVAVAWEIALLEGAVRGVGQVFLQDHLLAGVVVVAALALHSWRFALLALAGSALGACAGGALGDAARAADVARGLYGYDAALVAVAIPAIRGVRASSVAVGLAGALAAALLAGPAASAFAALELPRFTVAFIAVTTAALFVHRAR